MIPKYPKFKNLELTDIEEFRQLTSIGDPYSDFNFASLWAYDVNGYTKISKLFNNLVIIMQDYITDKPFLTFLGTNNTEKTIDTLLRYPGDSSVKKFLRLVPERSIQVNQNKLRTVFNIEEDLSNNDYVYSLENIANLAGSKFLKIRKLIRIFKDHFPNYKVRRLELSEKYVQKEVIDVFVEWSVSNKKEACEVKNECMAISRYFQITQLIKDHSIGVFVENKLLGFLISEQTHNNYVISHFSKAASHLYEGVYQLMTQEQAKMMLKHKCDFLNLEQDLGIPGLREAKRRWKPIKFLKKYTIEKGHL